MFCKYRYYEEDAPLDNIRMKVYKCNEDDDDSDCDQGKPCKDCPPKSESPQSPSVILRDIKWLECDPKFII